MSTANPASEDGNSGRCPSQIARERENAQHLRVVEFGHWTSLLFIARTILGKLYAGCEDTLLRSNKGKTRVLRDL